MNINPNDLVDVTLQNLAGICRIFDAIKEPNNCTKEKIVEWNEVLNSLKEETLVLQEQLKKEQIPPSRLTSSELYILFWVTLLLIELLLPALLRISEIELSPPKFWSNKEKKK